MAKGEFHRSGIMVSTPKPIQVFNKQSILDILLVNNDFLFGWPRHQLGYKVASLDIDYSEKHMNFLGTSGYLRLISISKNKQDNRMGSIYYTTAQVGPLYDSQPWSPSNDSLGARVLLMGHSLQINIGEELHQSSWQ